MGAPPAVAYVDSGTDPEGDSTSETGAFDISSSTRSVVRGSHRRNLKITTRTYGPDFSIQSFIHIDARLDARGGRQADAVLHIWIEDMSGSGCQLQTRSGRLLGEGRLGFVGDPSTDDPPYYAE